MGIESGITRVSPTSFDAQRHFYPQVLNAHIHPLVRHFFTLGNERIAKRYCHLHPEVSPAAVSRALEHIPTYMRWGGSDLFYTTDERGVRKMVVIETNSSPSGQKSMPILHEVQEQGSYKLLLERAFLPMLKKRGAPKQGVLAVLYDKNEMETTGYAAALADLTGEDVYLVACRYDDPDPIVRLGADNMLELRDDAGEWQPIRGAIKYVTQRPWKFIPPICRTVVLNPTLVCLAGGRNKLLAAKAYDFHNGVLEDTGLSIRTPETIWDVALREVPLWIERMGGIGVVKVPYSNAGQGVYTITTRGELDAFMAADHPYERFIVQSLIGNIGWSSRSAHGRLYHIGLVPDRHGDIYVADVRFMVGASEEGFFPVALYARQARSPLTSQITEGEDSWQMLGTNLSIKALDGAWDTESRRLLLMDSRNFNRLGLGLDDLIEGYIQTILTMTAIDEMAIRLVNTKGKFRRRFFATLNPDPALIREIDWLDPHADALPATKEDS